MGASRRDGAAEDGVAADGVAGIQGAAEQHFAVAGSLGLGGVQLLIWGRMQKFSHSSPPPQIPVKWTFSRGCSTNRD